jgi:type II secretory pathway pseudopilin PulG
MMFPKAFDTGRFACREKAFALVTVLFIIVMLALLIIGLLVSAEYRTRDSALKLALLDTAIASDTALNLVQAQIRAATVRGIDSDGRGTEAWASQPGAIRTFGNNGATTGVYKLYSSEVMMESDKNFITSNADLPPDWRSRPDWLYPIASTDSIGTVDGFSSSQADIEGTDWDDRLVMPVRWLYFSRDGSISVDPAAGDPVARVAFWTDDESCKINVNTASATDENSFWDIPRATLEPDIKKLAFQQPAQNEYNRYPGHPATVSLTTVFPNPGGSDNEWLKKLVTSTPRYAWGGSENGSLSIGMTRTPIDNSKTDRLYATIDEYLYSPDRSSQLNLSETSLDQRRFFLTASSRSSELNLFGQPRVTIWPVHALNNAQHRTAFDQLIAFCSRIGTGTERRDYHFVRSNSLSQTEDWASHARNRELFEYLRNMTSRDIPGYGGNFLEKYDTSNGGVSGERDQILTMIFDTIRATNLNETFAGTPLNYQGYTKMLRDEVDGSALAFERTGSSFEPWQGAGLVLPIQTPFGRGQGRVPVLSEVGLWFIRSTLPTDAPAAIPKIQHGIILETNTPSQGLMPWLPYWMSFAVRKPADAALPTLNGQPFLTGTTAQSTRGPTSAIGDSQSQGGTNGWKWIAGGPQTNTFRGSPLLAPANAAIEAPSGKIEIGAGELEIVFLAGGVEIQSYRVKVPAATLDAPGAVLVSGTGGGTNDVQWRGWMDRQAGFLAEDVVQAIAVKDGDYRTVASLKDVPASLFAPHEDYGSSAFAHGLRQYYNSMERNATNGKIVDVDYGSYDAGGTAKLQSALPDIPSGITSLRAKGWDGDFDNGIGSSVDGAYFNKTDEGSLKYQTANDNDDPDRAPYFTPLWRLGAGVFSPSRQSPSAVIFGSIPTGVKRTVAAYQASSNAAAPWRTLVFSPNPANPDHYGLKGNPPDRALLDLFTMPCVEPYAISEPLSTAGRLNMNYGILPFTHIKRSTPMRAALASQKIVAIPDTQAPGYKTTRLRFGANVSTRHAVDIDETLAQWEAKFDAGDAFQSATEICAQYLVPKTTPAVTLEGVKTSWWNTHRLTGDNSRERPYASLYPLLTTRSNTYTFHFRAQAIKRLSSGKINILAENRGSRLFERFIDPNDGRFGKDKIDPDAVSLEPYFRFRTLLTKKFNP